MTGPGLESALPKWKLVETMALVSFALVARGAVRLLDESTGLMFTWTDGLGQRLAAARRSTRAGRAR